MCDEIYKKDLRKILEKLEREGVMSTFDESLPLHFKGFNQTCGQCYYYMRLTDIVTFAFSRDTLMEHPLSASPLCFCKNFEDGSKELSIQLAVLVANGMHIRMNKDNCFGSMLVSYPNESLFDLADEIRYEIRSHLVLNSKHVVDKEDNKKENNTKPIVSEVSNEASKI